VANTRRAEGLTILMIRIQSERETNIPSKAFDEVGEEWEKSGGERSVWKKRSRALSPSAVLSIKQNLADNST